ncbi:hypothetical protein POTOM_045605 [Populus tomentosa]|uniref:Uncharacterized protein n=1 Tax=Populus tomentosa TaxID=118781 RepID=A0A8X7YDG6_POPTO|nr:hypothetical protein POTOM_045605 [Populus tomentosa]
MPHLLFCARGYLNYWAYNLINTFSRRRPVPLGSNYFLTTTSQRNETELLQEEVELGEELWLERCFSAHYNITDLLACNNHSSEENEWYKPLKSLIWDMMSVYPDNRPFAEEVLPRVQCDESVEGNKKEQETRKNVDNEENEAVGEDGAEEA